MPNTSAAVADPFHLTDIFTGLAGYTRVAVAVSGGSDSMALLVLVAQWNAVSVVALTVDHGLRAASADEALQVSQWCAAMGIEHHVLQWRGEKPKSGIQTKARGARYDLMSDWCIAHGVDALLTAHTLDDQAETVVMRKARTASVKSLAGIWPEMQWKGMRVVRPLLDMRREELRRMLRERGQTWIDDPSNDDERFERVRVRKAMDAGDVKSLSDAARAARRQTQSLAEMAKVFFDEAVKIDGMGCITIPRLQFAQLGADIAQEVLARAIFVGGAGVLPLRKSVVDLAGWVVGGGKGRRTLAGAIVAARTAEILVAREAGRISPGWLPATAGLRWDGRFDVLAPQGSFVAPALVAKGPERQVKVPVFAWNGLPVVKLPDGREILAHGGEKFGVSAIFRERIWF